MMMRKEERGKRKEGVKGIVIMSAKDARGDFLG